MSSLNKVAKNAGWIIGCRLVQAVLALIINFLTARYLGPSNFGVINYAASVVAFVVPLMQLGITSIVVNELVKKPEEEGKILGTSLVLTLLSSFACMIGVGTFAALANRDEPETVVVCILYSLMLVFQSTEMLQYWFQAKLRSKYVSLTVLAAYVAVAAYKVFLLITDKDVRWFALSNSIDYCLISIILFILYKLQGGQRLGFSFPIAKTLLRGGRYYILSGMMIAIFAQTDRIMIKMMMGNEWVGFYSAAVSIAGLSSFVFVAIISSFRPMILEVHQHDRAAFEKNLSILYTIVIYISLLQCVVMTLLATPIVRLLYGSAYDPAIHALRIVVWYTTFSYLGSARDVWILAEGKQKYLLIVNLSGAIGNVLLNLVLIPVWGINGAAAASLFTQMFANVILSLILRPLRPSAQLMGRGLDPRLLLGFAKTVLRKGRHHHSDLTSA